MRHAFTSEIQKILFSQLGEAWEDIYDKSALLQYLNIKTKSASHGAKARGSFANIYAVYVLVEDYLEKSFDTRNDYSAYEGSRFTDLLRRKRELPFGNKLQNHALNSRMNEEFKKYFSQIEYIPILRNLQTNRYWINENLLKIRLGGKTYNIAHAIIEIIDRYIEAKRGAFEQFIKTCERLKNVATETDSTIEAFITELLAPNADARIFEIVSYAILKQRLQEGAEKQFAVEIIVEKYMGCIEEIINIPTLRQRFKKVAKQGYLRAILNEIIHQSKVEFNYEEIA